MILHVSFESRRDEADDRIQVVIATLLAERLDRLVSTVCLNANPSMGHKYTGVPTEKDLFPGAPIGFKKEELMEEYYCAFLPLGLYCAFGASNIHHAYNKAAKHWGAKPLDWPLKDVGYPELGKTYRLRVYNDPAPFESLKRVSQKEMTALVKAWRETQ